MADSPRIEDLKRRVQSDPASIAFAALAEEYRRAGRFEEAIAACTAGLVRHPAYLSAHVTLGRALIEVARFDEARVELEHVLELAPENLAAIRGLADIHARHGEVQNKEIAAADHARYGVGGTESAREPAPFPEAYAPMAPAAPAFPAADSPFVPSEEPAFVPPEQLEWVPPEPPAFAPPEEPAFVAPEERAWAPPEEPPFVLPEAFADTPPEAFAFTTPEAFAFSSPDAFAFAAPEELFAPPEEAAFVLPDELPFVPADDLFPLQILRPNPAVERLEGFLQAILRARAGRAAG